MVAEAASPLPASHPPIKVFYYHYHNSIRTELDDLSAAVAALEDTSATDASKGLSDVKRRVAFLDRVYSIHSSVEDEVSCRDSFKHCLIVEMSLRRSQALHYGRLTGYHPKRLLIPAGGISCSGPEGQERHTCLLCRA